MIYAENAKARFDYEILDTYEAGIKLLGFEVKSAKNGRCSIVGARCIIRGGEVYIVGMKIDPYQAGNTPLGYDMLQTRKLLLHKKQITTLEKDGDSKGNTIIPLVVYDEKNLIKIKVALCRGKKNHDKRETLKKRDMDRTLARDYKVR
jgi:SsrA-binding protein